IDQLAGNRLPVDKDAQPAERIDALEDLNDVTGNAGPRYAVEAVATGDEVAVQPLGDAVLSKMDARLRSLEAFDRNVGSLIDGPRPASRSRIHEVARDLRLAIDQYMPAHEIG